MSSENSPRWSTIDSRKWTVGWEKYRGTVRIVEEWEGDAPESNTKQLQLPFYIATVHQMDEEGRFTDLVTWQPTQTIEQAKEHCRLIANQLITNALIKRLGKHFSVKEVAVVTGTI
jgi:hypothetical protein